ncbi:MAG TPA: PEP-utilizing enzyme [Ilumatobacteraceae bacterium]|nr:PEP-utilizing enzyme [Ilumatobacteraceae bacterium]
MAEVVPVDQFLEWYPGWKPEHIDNPWLRLKSGPFTKADEDKFWFVDFHWPRGFSPLGFSFVTDAAWSTQLAAHQLPLPPAGGLVQRMGGPFLYEGEVPVTSEWEIGYRAARIGKNMPRFLQNFDAIWDERKWELELGLGYFEGYDLAGKSLAELGQFMRDARSFQKRAWEIHFEIMYPLLAIYLQLYGVCAENGIDPGSIAKMLQGRDSKIMETDRAMWDLADEAKRLEITAHFDHEPEAIRDALTAAGGNASTWLTKFDDFLGLYGWRTEGIADINIPSWNENQASPLGQIRNFIGMDDRHDFDKSLEASHHERDEAIDDARSKLSGDALGAFNELLAINTVANFAWWNEDHNYYVDLRASIPMRRGALAVAAAVGADTYDDSLFLFFPELEEVCAGTKQWKDLQSIATARHEYYDHYQELRPTIPKVVGTLPDKIEDPVLIEIFGMHKHYFDGLKADAHTTVLSGFPASQGVVKGKARVMLSAMELFDLEEGEILVTEATSPNWTPAFAIIAACVCDGGGSLTHAATVSREYGIPCVVGTSVATLRIATGDVIEVDGTKGTVTILERAAG